MFHRLSTSLEGLDMSLSFWGLATNMVTRKMAVILCLNEFNSFPVSPVSTASLSVAESSHSDPCHPSFFRTQILQILLAQPSTISIDYPYTNHILSIDWNHQPVILYSVSTDPRTVSSPQVWMTRSWWKAPLDLWSTARLGDGLGNCWKNAEEMWSKENFTWWNMIWDDLRWFDMIWYYIWDDLRWFDIIFEMI